MRHVVDLVERRLEVRRLPVYRIVVHHRIVHHDRQTIDVGLFGNGLDACGFVAAAVLSIGRA
ncbi:hypothetical protein D3C78_1667590 [compost metagenome]